MISVALLGETNLAQELKNILYQCPDVHYLGHYHYEDLQSKTIKPKLIIISLLCNSELIVEQIKLLRKESKIFAFSPHCQADFVLDVLRAGVHAYLWQEELFEDLPNALRAVLAGQCVLSESIAAHLR